MQEILAKAHSLFVTPQELSLTYKGLSYVNWDRCEEDFDFVFDDGVCRVHSVLAEFLSKKVARIRKSDPCCCCYTFSGANSKSLSVFESFVSNIRSERPIEVSATNFAAILQIFLELENNEIYSTLWCRLHEKLCDLEHKLLSLELAMTVGIVDRKEFEETRHFVTSNFSEIDTNILDGLNLEVLEYLISSPSLKIVDEDWLYRFVKSRAERDERFMTFFEHVWFEYLSVENVQDFLSFINGRFLEIMNPNLWERICCRLVLDSKVNTDSSRVATQTKSQEPSGESDDDLDIGSDDDTPKLELGDGILAYLANYGDVSQIVDITGSGGNPRCVVEPSGSVYQSSLQIYPYLCFDFGEMQVNPTGYYLEEAPLGENGVTWIRFEGSWDGFTWHELDSQKLTNYTPRTFQLGRIHSTPFRYLRLLGTDEGRSQFYIRRFEIYGTLYGHW